MRELALPALRNGTSVITFVYRRFGRRDILSGSDRNRQSKWYTGLYCIRSYRWIRCFKNCLSDGKATITASSMKKVLMDSKELPFMMIPCKRSNVLFSPVVLRKLFASFPTKVNVTVAASRASVGPENMQVSIQSTPRICGRYAKSRNQNDQVHAVVDIYSATSDIAGWSVVSTLINIASPIVF